MIIDVIPDPVVVGCLGDGAGRRETRVTALSFGGSEPLHDVIVVFPRDFLTQQTSGPSSSSVAIDAGEKGVTVGGTFPGKRVLRETGHPIEPVKPVYRARPAATHSVTAHHLPVKRIEIFVATLKGVEK